MVASSLIKDTPPLLVLVYASGYLCVPDSCGKPEAKATKPLDAEIIERIKFAFDLIHAQTCCELLMPLSSLHILSHIVGTIQIRRHTHNDGLILKCLVCTLRHTNSLPLLHAANCWRSAAIQIFISYA